MNTIAKKILNISFKVITWLLVAFTVLMMIVTIFNVTTVGEYDRSIFGYKFYIVLSNSMKKTDQNADMDVHFNARDIVIVKEVKDRTKFKEGDIISFISTNNDDSWGKAVTHMVRRPEFDEEGKLLGYRTFGTATGSDDEVIVAPSDVLGEYVGKIPAAGKFFNFMKTTPGYIVCILIPFMLLIFYNGLNIIRLFRKYRREQMAVMQAERDKIEAERAENQRMMQELLALKAQLEQQGREAPPPAEPAFEVASAEKAETDETDETKSDNAASGEATDEN